MKSKNNTKSRSAEMKILTPKLFKFPLNSIKESEKIHEALSINFFISSSRLDKTDKKRIKLSGFAFLDYLFDHPYFVYNNYVPSWQRSSFFPASVFLNRFQNTNASVFVESFDKRFYNESFSPKRPRPCGDLVSEKIWPFLENPTRGATPNFNHLSWKKTFSRFYTNKSIDNKQNYPLYFTTNDTLLKTLAWRFFKRIKHTRFSKIWPCLIQGLALQNSLLLNHPNSETKNSLLGVAPHNKKILPKVCKQPSRSAGLVLYRNGNNQNIMSIYNNLNFSDRFKNRISLPILKLISQERKVMPLMKPELIWTNANRNGLNPGMQNRLKPEIGFKKNPIMIISSNQRPRRGGEKFIGPITATGFSNLPSQSQNQTANRLQGGNQWITKKNQHDFLYNQLDNQLVPSLQSEKTIFSNQLLASLVSILNTTNFRDVLFERFMNPKFYDIGLMGRKRLNKKLRLNIPLQCTTLTPLDFLAIFYKLFSLYKCDSFLSNLNYLPTYV